MISVINSLTPWTATVYAAPSTYKRVVIRKSPNDAKDMVQHRRCILVSGRRGIWFL